jgi:hypothetical protein
MKTSIESAEAQSDSDTTVLDYMTRSLKEISVNVQRTKMTEEERRTLQIQVAAIEFLLPRKLSS